MAVNRRSLIAVVVDVALIVDDGRRLLPGLADPDVAGEGEDLFRLWRAAVDRQLARRRRQAIGIEIRGPIVGRFGRRLAGEGREAEHEHDSFHEPTLAAAANAR